MDRDRRKALVRRLERLDRRARTKGEADVSVSADEEREHQRRQAVSQARLALAALGRSAFESGQSSQTFSEAKDQRAAELSFRAACSQGLLELSNSGCLPGRAGGTSFVD